ncbi:MAG: TetR/AcrR family transcriptional regulator [Desulfobacterales bacterium]|nr:TetR/AcrR family transcriptional regulator [Desulfobacterales bacterium]MCP4159116.1 TetR/AcrR family transcriptional regulator [Deltaproteobacteria bacterium]
MEQLSRKEREKKRKREEILTAALSVFAQKGYHGATMAEISQVSEYPLGTIYKFFQGKEQIYHEMIRETGVALGDILLNIIENDDCSPIDQIKKCFNEYIQYGIEKRDYFLIYNSQRSSIDAVLVPNINKSINKLHNKMNELLADIFEKGIEQGQFKSHSTAEMAHVFSSVVFSTIWMLIGEHESVETERLDNLFAIFMEGICVECTTHT